MLPGTKRVVLIAVFGTFGALVVGGVIVWIVYYASSAMRDVTHDFLGAVRTRHDDLAYQLTSADMRARVPAAAFAAYVEQRAPNVRTSQSEWINGFGGGSGRWCMDVWLSGANGRSSVYVMLVEENDLWRVSDVTNHMPSECDSGPN